MEFLLDGSGLGQIMGPPWRILLINSGGLLQPFSQIMAVAGFFKKLMTTFVLSQISNF